LDRKQRTRCLARRKPQIRRPWQQSAADDTSHRTLYRLLWNLWRSLRPFRFARQARVAGVLKIKDDGHAILELDGWFPNERGPAAAMDQSPLPSDKRIQGPLPAIHSLRVAQGLCSSRDVTLERRLKLPKVRQPLLQCALRCGFMLRTSGRIRDAAFNASPMNI
jgi:hypothetical protein